MYEASLAIHVVAAIVGFGATFTYPVIHLVAERRDPRALPFALATILVISRWVAVPATLLVGVTGVYQLVDGPYGLGELWVALGLGLYVGVMAVGILVFVPSYRRSEREARRMLEEGSTEPSSGYRSATRLPKLLGPVTAAAIVATAVLMELKPG